MKAWKTPLKEKNIIPSHGLIPSQGNLFKVNNKDTRTRSLRSFWCHYF